METFGLRPGKVVVGDMLDVDGTFKEVTSTDVTDVDGWMWFKFTLADLSQARVPADAIVTIRL